ncbi:nucleotide sugar dehydrogenase [Methanomicrobium mobile]|uniref:nucleotide sugar dehydrogenase n=1 Tax=Methanomicrobium mobile TaxID=2205 RepID=UPI0005B2D12C|nr:nucleotide sugar dehydrogenase [Methanomicrobium mobile]
MNKLEDIIKARGPINKVGVIGMGYVGIPAAMLQADVPNRKVYGFQRESKTSGYKIDMLNNGECPLKGIEPGLEELVKKVVNEGKFTCTSDFSKISELDAVTLSIQTPFKDPKDLIPNFDALIEGLKNVGKYLVPGTLVVLESTITPGTTTILAKDILEKESDLKAGVDFALAHAPERVMVGRLLQNIREYDRCVGGIDDVSTARAIELYAPILTKGKVIPMSATEAEVTKTTENTLRDLQIAAANQLALYCEAMGINFYNVKAGIDSLKGEGLTRALLLPGAGVGGHCLTKDTYHLERGMHTLSGEKYDYPKGEESIYVLARHINDFMPKHMINLTKNALRCDSLRNKKIALLGWAFLANTDDARNTPSETYRSLAQAEGACIKIHDVWVKSDQEKPDLVIDKDISETVKGADAVILLTAHNEYKELDPKLLKKMTANEHPAVIDGRNIFDPDSFINNGWIYRGIGRGDKNNLS